MPNNSPAIETKDTNKILMEEFKQKVEIMKDVVLLSDEKFNEEQEKLLNMI